MNENSFSRQLYQWIRPCQYQYQVFNVVLEKRVNNHQLSVIVAESDGPGTVDGMNFSLVSVLTFILASFVW